ncbi:MAG: preprotein translocase subunit YajC [Actinomycetota bacterium]|nr:preprotein translocase subunit YajC [Actinomycetota bacterium]
MKNIKKTKTTKIAMIVIIATLITLIGIVSSGCQLLAPTGAAGSTTIATNADGTPVQQSWLAKYGTWIWLVILVVAFYFLLIRPQRQKSKTQQDLLGNLKRGDEIVTVGGIYGRIKDISGEAIIVTISSGVDIKITKSAISRKITQDVSSSDAGKK